MRKAYAIRAAFAGGPFVASRCSVKAAFRVAARLAARSHRPFVVYFLAGRWPLLLGQVRP